VAPCAKALPTWCAPNRFMVRSRSVLLVRQVSLPVSGSRAMLLLQSRRATRGEACEDM